VLGNTFLLDFSADHETGDVLQEDDWDLSLRAQLHEMSALLSALREKHTVVGDDADRVTVEVTETCNQSFAVELLELMESRAVQKSAEDHVHVEFALVVNWDNTVQLVSVEKWGFRSLSAMLVFLKVALHVHVANDGSRNLECMHFAVSEVV